MSCGESKGDEIVRFRPRERREAALLPFTVVYATDVALTRLAHCDPEGALGALWLGARGAERLPPEAPRILAEAVRARRSLWRLGLRVALSGGTPLQRAAGAAAVVGACARAQETRIPEHDGGSRTGGSPRPSCSNREAIWRSDP